MELSQPTRRHLFQFGGAAAAAWNASPLDPVLQEAVAKLEYLTPLERAYILDKGKANVGKLPPEKLSEIRLTPETWSLDVAADTVSGSVVENPFTLRWQDLMRLAGKHAVRFPHITTCTNGADPFHMSMWEGVPLREVLWLAKPKENIRRVYYQSYHQPDLKPFQASMAMGHILEPPPGQFPAVLAYSMNGQPIPASHGGPVRMIVHGAYGNKSIKWVQRVVMTNDYKANDSDAELNNDTESPLKTRARFINAPKQLPANKPAALTGMAQVGISGLKQVQYCFQPDDWKEAIILPPPAAIPAPAQWPLRYTIVHWAALLPALPPGSYDLCCRTIDGNGIAQPMPRPFLHTGFNAIQRITVSVKA